MKLALFGDLHMGIKQDSPDWHEVAIQWGERFIEEMKNRSIDTVIFLGDFFHNRSTVSVNTLYAASNFLDLFYKNNINLHMILGNHDLYYLNDPTVSGVALFKRYPNIFIYSKPTHVKFGSKSCCFCGWGYNPFDQESADILFTHAEINLFRFNNKQGECSGGLKCSDLIGKFKLVYTGHFHMRQNKQWNNGEVRYPGNPFQMDFSDEGDIKGFEIYDTETGDIEFVGDRKTPRFFRIRLSDLIKNRKRDMNLLKSEITNSYFKLIIDMSITLQDLDILMSLINSCKPRTSSYEWENGMKFSQNMEEGDFHGFELKDAIVDFINQMDIPKKEEVATYILSLYNKVNELNK